MSIVLARNLVLTEAEAGLSLDHPIVLWDNLVTFTGITADSEAAGYPATNLANPVTALEWRGASAADIEIAFATNHVDPINGFGIARHNFGSEAIALELGYYDEDDEWVVLIEEFIPQDDAPLLLRYARQSLADVVLRLAEGDAAPRAAVAYCGDLLVLQRKLWVGHTPIVDGLVVEEVSAMSQAGDYLGTITVSSHNETKLTTSLLDPDWYRENMRAFVQSRSPFFFAARPQTYPLEVGYCHIVNSPRPVPDDQSHLIAIDIDMRGVVQ